MIKVDMDKLERLIEEELRESEPNAKTIIDIVLDEIYWGEK